VTAFALASVLGGVLGLFRLSVLKKTETGQQLLNAFVPLNVLVLSLGMAAFGVLFLLIGWIPPLNLVFFRSFVICLRVPRIHRFFGELSREYRELPHLD
jgi:hypothetical protein